MVEVRAIIVNYFYWYKMNSAQLNEYFERIGYSPNREVTVENLRNIQAHQAYSIPFETFDILMGRPIVLELEPLFNKLVREKRGGYCYELNALLHFVLEALGFTTSLCVAHLAEDKESVHMLVIVTLEQKWLVDVGWGSGFSVPFCLDEPKEQCGYTIRADGDGYCFCQNDKVLYSFMLEKYPLAFFETRNHYHQTSPKSLFANEVFCSKATPEGYEMISGSQYIQKKGDAKLKQTIKTDAEYRALLKNIFGLDLQVKRPVFISHNGYLLHTPRSRSDRDAYHRIRFCQIHTRYCPELTYDPDDPEERDLNNFPLVFRQEGQDQIIGTIRIDLLAQNEASFRWVAIDAPFVRQGFGAKMLDLAERFVREHKRALIRIPATAQSLPFAHYMGYKEEPWDLMPKEECMIAVCKRMLG